MIKFRCPRCRQKIKATDEQAGRSGPCPHCDGSLTVPNESDAEFRVLQQEERVKELEKRLAEAGERIRFLEDLQSRTDADRRRIEEILKRNLVPQFAGFLEDKMMKKLRDDHQQLNVTHDTAQNRIDDLEERLARAQDKIQQKLRAYEVRIAELEEELRRARGGPGASPLLSLATPATKPVSL